MAFNKVQNATTRTFERVLPYDLYTNPEVVREEKDKIFSTSWQLVGHVSQVQNAGSFFTTEVAGSLFLSFEVRMRLCGHFIMFVRTGQRS